MNRLKELRLKHDKTQQDIANYLNLTPKAISFYEKEERGIPNATLQKLADYFHVSTDYLLGRPNAQRPDESTEEYITRMLSEQPNMTQEEKEKLRENIRPRGIKIPVLGTIVAGIPLEAVQEILDYEEIPAAMAKHGEYFALRVKGRSMEPNYIEGDTVIVRKESTVNSGRVAVVLINGEEATLKKVKISPDGITLIGFNPVAYEPHYYSNKEIKELPVQIIGEVVELRRKV